MKIKLILATGFLSTHLAADMIYFRGGGSAQLAQRRRGDKVSIDAPGGEVELDAREILRVIPSASPRAEWPGRRAEGERGGGEGRFGSGWWALENGLTAEATSVFRDLAATDPRREPNATLVRTLDRIAPPLEDPETGEVLLALGGEFLAERSDHFLLFHQVERSEAAARLAMLERVFATFYLTFAAGGLELAPPRSRLVGVLYAKGDDYRRFLDRESASAFATAQGYFHPTRNAVVAFDPRDLPSQRAARSRLAGRRADGMGSNLARETLLLDLERRSIGLGLAAHETIHQLAVNSGLTPRHDDFPTWLHEGLAAQFEVIRGGEWAGVGRAHDLRLPDWRSIRPAPRLLPLLRDEGFAAGYRRDLYASAWSLVYFLRKRHPAEFAALIDLLRAPTGHENHDPTRFLYTFRTAFGDDLSGLEAEWHRFMKTIETPIEAGARSMRGGAGLPLGRD